jgi:hypothetical protein
MNFSKDSIKTELVQIFSQLTKYTKNVITSGVYDVLLNLFAYILEKWSYYAEFLFKEGVWKKATRRESMIPQSYLLNYTPHRRIGASNKIIVSPFPLDTVSALYNSGEEYIPKWTPVSNVAGSIEAYTTETKIIYDNTRVVVKSPDLNSTAVDAGNGRVRLQITGHEIPFNSSLKIVGSKYYDGEYVNLNNSSDLSFKSDFIIIETTFNSETFVDTNVKVYAGQALITIKQGTPKEYPYVATGEVDEEIILFSDKIENDIFEVYMTDDQGNIIRQVEIVKELYLLNDTSKYACQVINNDEYTQVIVKFGDGVRSRKTVENERYLIKYAETLGASGNINAAGAITTIDSNFVLNSQGNNVTLYLTNFDPISGGSDLEDIESIRINGKELSNRLSILSKPESWQAVVNSYPLVLRSKVWTDAELEIFQGNMNVTHITAVSKAGRPLTSSEKTAISVNLLNPIKSTSDIIKWEPLAIVHTFFSIKATIKNIPSEQAKAEIAGALTAQYSILSKLNDFAISIRSSNYVAFIDNLDNVKFHKTTLSHYERSDYISTINAATAGYKIQVSRTAADEPNVEKQVIIKNNSVQLYLRRKINKVWYPDLLIGVSDDAIINGANGYTITAGVVNYGTNELDFNINDILQGPVIPASGGVFPDEGSPFSAFGKLNPGENDTEGYVIKIRYKTEDGNGNNTEDIRLPYFYNIVDCLVEDMAFDLSYD